MGKRWTMDDINNLVKPGKDTITQNGKQINRIVINTKQTLEKKMGWNEKKQFYIGIDCGVNTGFAVWDSKNKSFSEISTLQIDEAMEKVLNMHNSGHTISVRIEDARLRKSFIDKHDKANLSDEEISKKITAKAQGAGSVKRDATIWEDFLTRKKIPFDLVNAQNNRTKLEKEPFVKLTKYTGLTSKHGRDAAMLVFGI